MVLDVGAEIGCSPSWYQTRLRPAFFAAYKASSARLMSVAGLSSPPICATPTEAVTCSSTPPWREMPMAIAARIRSPASRASASGVLGRITANSSPP